MNQAIRITLEKLSEPLNHANQTAQLCCSYRNVASVFRIQSLSALGCDFITTKLSVLQTHTISCDYWVIIHHICLVECKGSPELLYKMEINNSSTGDHPVGNILVSEAQNHKPALQFPSVQELIPRGLTENLGAPWQQAPKGAEFHLYFTALIAAAKWKPSHGWRWDLHNKTCIEIVF